MTTRQYVLTVIRAPSSVADLSSLQTSVAGDPLVPSFGATVVLYNMSVGNLVHGMTLTPTAAHPFYRSITVNGNATASGAASGYCAFPDGSSSHVVVVTAQDGVTTKSYIIVVTRALSSNAHLASVSLSPMISMLPGFHTNVTAYQAESPTLYANPRLSEP